MWADNGVACSPSTGLSLGRAGLEPRSSSLCPVAPPFASVGSCRPQPSSVQTLVYSNLVPESRGPAREAASGLSPAVVQGPRRRGVGRRQEDGGTAPSRRRDQPCTKIGGAARTLCSPVPLRIPCPPHSLVLRWGTRLIWCFKMCLLCATCVLLATDRKERGRGPGPVVVLCLGNITGEEFVFTVPWSGLQRSAPPAPPPPCEQPEALELLT